MEEFRSRLKQESTIFDLGNQAIRSLVGFQDLSVAGQVVDVRQPRALQQQIANRDPIPARDAGNQIAHMGAEAERLQSGRAADRARRRHDHARVSGIEEVGIRGGELAAALAEIVGDHVAQDRSALVDGHLGPGP